MSRTIKAFMYQTIMHYFVFGTWTVLIVCLLLVDTIYTCWWKQSVFKISNIFTFIIQYLLIQSILVGENVSKISSISTCYSLLFLVHYLLIPSLLVGKKRVYQVYLLVIIYYSLLVDEKRVYQVYLLVIQYSASPAYQPSHRLPWICEKAYNWWLWWWRWWWWWGWWW